MKTTMTTMEMAEYMLQTGKFYRAATLSKELNVPLDNASGNLYNIRNTKKYQVIEQGHPVETKVIDIQGVRHKQRLWTELLNSAWPTQIA